MATGFPRRCESRAKSRCRETALRAELQQFQEEKDNFYDSCNAKMVTLDKEEKRIALERERLDEDLLKFRRSVADLTQREKDASEDDSRRAAALEAKEAELADREDALARSRAEVETLREAVEQREASHASSRQDLEIREAR